MDLHHGMILSTLSRSSHVFTFGIPKRPHMNEDSIPYKSIFFSLISQPGTTSPHNPQQVMTVIFVIFLKIDEVCFNSMFRSEIYCWLIAREKDPGFFKK